MNVAQLRRWLDEQERLGHIDIDTTIWAYYGNDVPGDTDIDLVELGHDRLSVFEGGDNERWINIDARVG